MVFSALALADLSHPCTIIQTVNRAIKHYINQAVTTARKYLAGQGLGKPAV